jgi:quercetin dioxygenase-like cupin family protein
MEIPAKYDKAMRLENYIKANMEAIELNVEHFQIPGVYVRVLKIPKGTVLTGKVHNYDCISIVAKGKIMEAVEERVIEEGQIFYTAAGTKRAGYAISDCIFITVHRTDNTDIKEIESELVSDSVESYIEHFEVVS